ncbi:MAG TPA: GntR family transcriptional regulator [Treponema sp.]|nr:GntR family transcriptional regulator [Treponema sp.]
MRILEKKYKETNHDYAFRVIKENIVDLELQPGSMISEQEIASMLDLSRTPVHEALQELAKTKIVEILPQRGSLVSLIDMNLVEESCFIRATIESAVTELACKKAESKDIDALEENIVLQEFYYTKQNYDKFMEYDNAFHKAMYEIAGRMLSYYTVQLMNIHHNRFRTLGLHISNAARIVSEHRTILAAVKQHDCEKAKKEFLQHINRTFIDEKEIRQKYPAYFK